MGTTRGPEKPKRLSKTRKSHCQYHEGIQQSGGKEHPTTISGLLIQAQRTHPEHDHATNTTTTTTGFWIVTASDPARSANIFLLGMGS